MSSDSSDDENSELLREAVDQQFINDGMFSQNKSEKASPSTVTQPDTDEDLKNAPSLRPKRNEEDQFNKLGVTPQFQQHVAKQLSSLLDQKLRKRLKNGIHNEVPHKRNKSGIKLFSDSKKYIKLKNGDANTRRIIHNNKPTKRNCDSEKDNEIKCNEVAVKPEDILNKTETKHWAERAKAPVFKYQKTKNGTLIAID